MSLEANPIDAHRATDAVLVQLDILAEQNPRLLFIATSNFPEAVDSAFTSRCDLVAEIPLPDAEACTRILTDCLAGLADRYHGLRPLLKGGDLARCGAECLGLDGRAIRKMVVNALASSKELALDPGRLQLEDVVRAAKAARAARSPGARRK